MSSTDIDSLAYRLSEAEANIRALQPTTETADTNTETMSGQPVSVSATSGFTPVYDTLLSLTKDSAWHTITVSGVPSNATALLLRMEQKQESTIDNPTTPGTPCYFLVTTDASHTNSYVMAEAECDIAANRIRFSTQGMAPVGATFDYFIDNDTNWTLGVYLQGYWVP